MQIGLGEKRQVAHILAHRVDQADVAPGRADHGERGQLGRADFAFPVVLLEHEGKRGNLAKRAVLGAIGRGENDVFIGVDCLAECTGSLLCLLTSQRGDSGVGKNKIQPDRLNPALLKQRIERKRKELAVPRKIPQPADRFRVHIHIGQIHRSLDRPPKTQSRIDRVILEKRQRAVRAEECLRAGEL